AADRALGEVGADTCSVLAAHDAADGRRLELSTGTRWRRLRLQPSLGGLPPGRTRGGAQLPDQGDQAAVGGEVVERVAPTNFRARARASVIAVPTTTACAPAAKAALTCAGVWKRPSATTGRS